MREWGGRLLCNLFEYEELCILNPSLASLRPRTIQDTFRVDSRETPSKSIIPTRLIDALEILNLRSHSLKLIATEC